MTLDQFRDEVRSFAKQYAQDTNPAFRRAVATARELQAHLDFLLTHVAAQKGPSPGMEEARAVRGGASPDEAFQQYRQGGRV